jgi:hypothetical protein
MSGVANRSDPKGVPVKLIYRQEYYYVIERKAFFLPIVVLGRSVNCCWRVRVMAFFVGARLNPSNRVRWVSAFWQTDGWMDEGGESVVLVLGMEDEVPISSRLVLSIQERHRSFHSR